MTAEQDQLRQAMRETIRTGLWPTDPELKATLIRIVRLYQSITQENPNQ